MSGSTIIAPNAPVFLTRFGRARRVASDLLIAVGVIWAVPLLLAAVAAAGALLMNR